MDPVQQEVDKLYKKHFGKMVASLLHLSRDLDLETAEDIVQDAFSTALTDWRQKEIPANTMGWIYRVCRNRMLNILKTANRLSPLPDTPDQGMAGTSFNGTTDIPFSGSAFEDQQLKLLFACAHPDLSPKAQVVITLKYVLNLRVAVIAQSLGMTIDGVDKLLLRSRQKIKDEKIILEEPPLQALEHRLPIVHKIIYLTFNEGYKSSGGKDILREELCEEALILSQSLLNSQVKNKETEALHALMLFNGARFSARFDPSGAILDLESQDRTLWDHNLIELAHDHLNRSQSTVVTSYHLEAAIACMHCVAKTFASTEWTTIAGLYARLLQLNPNPFVELNHAIALFYAGEKAAAFKILYTLERHAFLHQYHLLNMTLGKFHHLEGNDNLAREFLEKAFHQAQAVKEKEFIRRMIDNLNDTHP